MYLTNYLFIFKKLLNFLHTENRKDKQSIMYMTTDKQSQGSLLLDILHSLFPNSRLGKQWRMTEAVNGVRALFSMALENISTCYRCWE